MARDQGNRPERLSEMLPVKWEEYEQWRRRSSGLRSYLLKRMLDLQLSGRDLAEALQRRLSNGQPGKAVKTFENKLSRFFKGKADIDLEMLQEITAQLGIAATPPVDPLALDLARRSWEARRPKRDVMRHDRGSALPLIHTGPRFFDAHLRYDLPASSPPDYVVSPRQGAVFVREGRLRAEFLRLGDPALVEQGGVLLYDGTFPHRFSAAAQGTAIVHITTGHEDSNGGVYEARAFSYEGDLDRVASEPKAAWQANIAIALQRSRRPESLASRCGLAAQRLGELSRGLRTPKEDDIRRIAAALRLPESTLFLGFGPDRVRRTYRVVDRSDTLEPARSRIRPGQFHHYVQGIWDMTPIHRWPATTWASGDGFLLSAISVRGPAEPDEAEWRYHHFDAEAPQVVDPGEEFIIVVAGRLGMRFREHDGGGITCSGELDAGDSIFFNSELEHSFYCPGEPARILHFWRPYPQSTLGDTVDQAGEEPA